MDTSLERSPVYQQLNQRLRSILVSECKRGEQFLTERVISERFQVSRATANKALASLVSEGLLEFRKGLGTFVRHEAIDYDVRALVSFTEKARAAGKRPSTDVITFAKCTAADSNAEVTAALAVAPSALLWQLERVRKADGTPVIWEQRFIVHEHCPKLTKAQAAGSLYKAWTETHRLQIAGANEVIRAVLLEREEARRLHAAVGSPALEVNATGYLANERPLWWERTLYRGDQYEFHSRLGPIQTATPARGVLRHD
jgi:GntR family transcriptional regulator